jgi:cytoplasmic iron level regulating protein YaaA (DUF328/UPF0246 family)
VNSPAPPHAEAMLILLSPAKTLDFESEPTIDTRTTPEFLDEAAELVDGLKSKTQKQLSALMGISDDLAELNAQRYQDWDASLPKDASKQSVLAFKGDVYQGLEADQMTGKQLEYAQDHLRILSGLYGVLRPLDAMLPYRLEMGTKLKTKHGKDLYEFWDAKITESVASQLKATNSKYLLNLASNEYFRSVHAKQLGVPVISPVFKDWKNGQYKMISFFAKVARGTMASWVIRNKARTPKKLIQFDGDGYRYDEESSTETKPVFLRDQKPAG